MLAPSVCVPPPPRSFPKAAEWPGDRLEAGMPADKLGELLGAYARPYSLTESRSASSNPGKVTQVFSRPIEHKAGDSIRPMRLPVLPERITFWVRTYHSSVPTYKDGLYGILTFKRSLYFGTEVYAANKICPDSCPYRCSELHLGLNV